ncbi:MAG: hypothetical protein ACKVVP_22815 [Chloroflexota bacterium]
MIRFLLSLLIGVWSFIGVPGFARASQPGIIYVPTASEIARLLAPIVELIPNEAENDGWDASVGFTVLSRPDRAFQLISSARVLGSDLEGRSFLESVGSTVSNEHERTDAKQAPEVARLLNADEALEFRLIYEDPDVHARKSDYARLLRFGRVVILVEAIGDPSFDDTGRVDTERERSLNRISELIAGKVAFYPPDSIRIRPAIAPFAKDWSRHGVNLNVEPTGQGELSWRIYRWCRDDPTPPCDRIYEDVVDPGGGAAIAILRVDGFTAHGVVIGTTDADTVALGPVTMTRGDYGMLELRQVGAPIILCGPDFQTLAPPERITDHPCGA